jgi:hypothetical protein
MLHLVQSASTYSPKTVTEMGAALCQASSSEMNGNDASRLDRRECNSAPLAEIAFQEWTAIGDRWATGNS